MNNHLFYREALKIADGKFPLKAYFFREKGLQGYNGLAMRRAEKFGRCFLDGAELSRYWSKIFADHGPFKLPFTVQKKGAPGTPVHLYLMDTNIVALGEGPNREIDLMGHSKGNLDRLVKLLELPRPKHLGNLIEDGASFFLDEFIIARK